MLNEPSVFSSSDSAPQDISEDKPKSLKSPIFEQIETMVAEVCDIYEVDYNPPPPASIRFTGRLRVDSEKAYTRLDEQFSPLDYYAALATNDEGQHVIVALKGRVNPIERPKWPHAVLLVLTILSLLFVGAQQSSAENGDDFFLLDGWPFALGMILILGTHELGHYVAARRHNLNVSLPYFIPFPLHIFGTLGAFILFREPMRNRKQLFDVGVAGPLAGLIVAIPVLFIGLATSDVQTLPQNEDYMFEGDSLFYSAAKYLVFGELLPNDNEDVFINQVAWAGWTGLLLTALNLIPAGQLDGGHVIYTLLGNRTRDLYWPMLVVMIVLSMLSQVWWMLLFLFLLFGRLYAVPLDSITPLDPRRRWLAYLTLVIFVLVFVPMPLQIITAG